MKEKANEGGEQYAGCCNAQGMTVANGRLASLPLHIQLSQGGPRIERANEQCERIQHDVRISFIYNRQDL